jgi:hypothetical protein
MRDCTTATLSLWPATHLPQSVVDELHSIGVDPPTLQAYDGRVVALRTREGQIGLRITLYGCVLGLGHTNMQAVLARLRLARINYVLWSSDGGLIYDAARDRERECAAHLEGERAASAPFTDKLAPQDVNIAVHDDDMFAVLCELVPREQLV